MLEGANQVHVEVRLLVFDECRNSPFHRKLTGHVDGEASAVIVWRGNPGDHEA
jgi:hypothetical protein